MKPHDTVNALRRDASLLSRKGYLTLALERLDAAARLASEDPQALAACHNTRTSAALRQCQAPTFYALATSPSCFAAWVSPQRPRSRRAAPPARSA